MKKRLSSIVLAFCILVGMIATVPFPANAEKTTVMSTGATSGVTGECNWSFDESTGTLTISGNGKMGDYFSISNEEYMSKIKKIIIEDGVKNIGDGAFSCQNLTSVKISDSVTSIGEWAFAFAYMYFYTVSVTAYFI